MGLPFVGPAGKLLEQLLGEIGLERKDVFINNTLMCLRYNARVQLGDGSWERIGRLVRSRYDGDVMSVDTDGRVVPRKVVGWHATPRGDRKVFRLTFRSAQHAGRGRTGIQLTGDHPVLTERGYIRVDSLRPTDRIATGQGLSDVARNVVCGTLLGDGHIQSVALRLTGRAPAPTLRIFGGLDELSGYSASEQLGGLLGQLRSTRTSRLRLLIRSRRFECRTTRRLCLELRSPSDDPDALRPGPARRHVFDHRGRGFRPTMPIAGTFFASTSTRDASSAGRRRSSASRHSR